MVSVNIILNEGGKWATFTLFINHFGFKFFIRLWLIRWTVLCFAVK